MEISEFITLCDEQFQLYPFVKQRTNQGYDRVYAEARTKIYNQQLVAAAVDHLRQKLVIFHCQDNLDYSRYISVLASIREAARRSSDSTELGEANWSKLISIIIENRGELYAFDLEAPSFLHSQLEIFAYSYLRLKNLGVEISERDYNFFISENSYKLIDSVIDQLCRSYGGENLLSALSDILGKTYNKVTGRFMEYRHLSAGSTEVHPAIPFGYLIAISLKYIGTKGIRDSRTFETFLLLISDLIVIFEIQPYNQFEAMHLESSSLIKFIQNNIFYDGFIGIAQTKASYASALIRNLKERFSDQEHASFGVGLKDITRVALALISLSNTKKFVDVQINDISSKSKISKSKVVATMDKILSIPAKAVNSELQFPPSSMKIDHYFKPTIKVGDSYRIFPKSIAAQGCLNSVCNSITTPNGRWENRLDSNLGYAIEDFLRNAFSNKGIRFSNGDRSNGKPNLEADLICETDDTIFIFEMKKKGLTRQAQTGDESKIFSDLADSVLASHLQAMRIEKVLKNNEALDLIYQGTKSTVCLNGRSVFRISISLHDFGALQDKIILQRILTIAVHSNVSHPNNKEDAKLKKWREYSTELRDLAIENGELGVAGRIPFHNSLFMSIPQIIMVLDQSISAHDFFKKIRYFANITTGSRDTYSEFLNNLTILNNS